MKKVHKQIITKEIEEITKTQLYCNKCEKLIHESKPGQPSGIEGVTVSFITHYGSFCDGDDMKFDLCNDCAIKLYDSLKIPPELY